MYTIAHERSIDDGLIVLLESLTELSLEQCAELQNIATKVQDYTNSCDFEVDIEPSDEAFYEYFAKSVCKKARAKLKIEFTSIVIPLLDCGVVTECDHSRDGFTGLESQMGV